MDKELKFMEIGINRFFYYIHNYACVYTEYPTLFSGIVGEYLPDFLGGTAWSCNTEHMVEKWKGCVARSDNSASAIIRFYGELDTTNRQAMLEYICITYNGECKLFRK